MADDGRLWVLFHVSCPAPEGRSARDLWEIVDEPDEVAIRLEGDVGPVALG